MSSRRVAPKETADEAEADPKMGISSPVDAIGDEEMVEWEKWFVLPSPLQ